MCGGGRCSFEQCAALALFAWWLPGAGTLTFAGPFVRSSNGYFGAWGGLACSAWLAVEVGAPCLSRAAASERAAAADPSRAARHLLLASSLLLLVAAVFLFVDGDGEEARAPSPEPRANGERERPRFAQWRASAFVDYTKGYDGPGRKSIEDDPAAERQTKQFGYRNDVWTNVDDARAEVKYLLTDGKGESTKDLELMLQRAGVALTSYIELAPPADIAEARASAASRK